MLHKTVLILFIIGLILIKIFLNPTIVFQTKTSKTEHSGGYSEIKSSEDCFFMGYTKSIFDCPQNGIVCPLNKFNAYCPDEDKNTQILSGCEIGDILTEDLECTKSALYLNTSLVLKTPIAVVFSQKPHLAVALNETKTTRFTFINSMFFLSKCSEENYSQCETDGKLNTRSLKNSFGNTAKNTDNPVNYCLDYVTRGTKKENWYLPSGYEHSLLHKNLNVVNSVLNIIDKHPQMNTIPINENGYYITSNMGKTNLLIFSMKESAVGDFPFAPQIKARPIIAF